MLCCVVRAGSRTFGPVVLFCCLFCSGKWNLQDWRRDKAEAVGLRGELRREEQDGRCGDRPVLS